MTLKLLLNILFIALSSTIVCSQQAEIIATDSSQYKAVLLRLGNEVYHTEYMRKQYQRAKLVDTIANLSPQVFLQNFTKNQLFVKYAERDGKHLTEAFKGELATLRKELSEHFLDDSVAKNKLIKEAYTRMAEEVQVAHILVAVDEWASPADTLDAYGRIITLRNRLLSGENFSEIAKTHSDDKSVNINEGNLGYITAFQTVYSFENVAYQTPVGSISMPFRTKYGYHLIKVLSKRPYQRWRTAHIFVAATRFGNEAANKAAKAKIDEAYALLQSGKDFATVCRNYSEDATTSGKAGEFKRLFGSDELEKSFEEALFALKTNGSYSIPIQTSKGWHIVKLIEKQSLKPYEAMYNFLQNKVKSDSRSEAIEKAVVAQIKKQNNFAEDLQVKNMALQMVDSLMSRRAKIESEGFGLKSLFKIGTRVIRTRQFFDYVEKEKIKTNGKYNHNMPGYWYGNFANAEILAYAENTLESINPEFAAQITEYRENILINKVYDEQIWARSVEDTTAQATFYQNNMAKFVTQERAEVEIWNAKTGNDLSNAKEMFAESPYKLSIKWRNLSYKKNVSELSPEHDKHLLDLAALMHKNPDYKLEILGNIDPEENDSISGNRAYNVEQYLLKRGVKPGRIVVKDNGKFKPLSKTNRSLNSRVEFALSTENKQDVTKLYNSLRNNALVVTEGTFRKSENEILKAIKWDLGTQQISKDGRQILINIKKVYPQGQLSLQEARGLVIKQLQADLEDKLLKRIMQEFPVHINQDELSKIQ